MKKSASFTEKDLMKMLSLFSPIFIVMTLAPHLVLGDQPIRIISPTAPPVIYFDEKANNSAGYLYDYWKTNIEPKVGKTIWLATIPGDRIIAQMNENKIDLGISAKNLARFPESIVEYSTTPIYQATQIVVGRRIWPKDQEKTVLVSADSMIPPELSTNPKYKVIKLYGMDIPKRAAELMEQKRAWGFYAPVHWTCTIELLRRKQLAEFSPYHLPGNPKREFYLFASKKLPSDVRKKIFRAINHSEIQQSIDLSLSEACHKIDPKACDEFLEKLK